MKHPVLLSLPLLVLACSRAPEPPDATPRASRDVVALTSGAPANVTGGATRSDLGPTAPFIQAADQRRAGARVDFNGDGREDFAKVFREVNEASFEAYLSTGTSFNLWRFATRQGGIDLLDMEFFTGDFDGDGRTDVAKLFSCGPQGGEACIDVHRSVPGNQFVIERWATQQGGRWKEQRWFPGDFDGDRKTDLAKCWGEWVSNHYELDCDVHLARAGAFEMQRWATRQGGLHQEMQFFVGDYDGDGRTDFAKVFPVWVTNHNEVFIDVHLARAGTFDIQRWANNQGWGPDGQTWLAGDFNGDGRTDLLKYWPDGPGRDLTADLHTSTGAGFTLGRWGSRLGTMGPGAQLLAGDYTGDGRTDLAHLFTCGSAGDVACVDVLASQGSTASPSRWATMQGGYSREQNWFAGDFTGAGRASLMKWWPEPVGGGNYALTSDVHPSSGSAFTMARWATKHGGALVRSDRTAMRFVPEPAGRGLDLLTPGNVGIELTGHQVTVAQINASTCPRGTPRNGAQEQPLYVPDGPARAYVDPSGRTRLILPHYLSYAFVGNSLTDASLDCSSAISISNQDPDPTRLDDQSWPWAFYRVGSTAVTLYHMEYHPWAHPERGLCPAGSPSHYTTDCNWYSSINWGIAYDGVHFASPAPPAHVAARGPQLAYQRTVESGYSDHSGILWNPADGRYYVTMLARGLSDNQGMCIMRSDNLSAPGSWRVYTADGYVASGAQGTACKGIIPFGYHVVPGSLSFSTYLGRAVMLTFGWPEGGEGGYYLFVAEDAALTRWSAPIFVMRATLPWGDNGGIPNGVMHAYPSLLAQGPDATGNFDQLGQDAWLYFIRWRNNDPTGTRDVVRVPVRFRKDVNPGTVDVAPAKGLYRVGGGGHYANGTGQYCAITSMEQLRGCGWTQDFWALPEFRSHSNMEYQGRCACGQ